MDWSERELHVDLEVMMLSEETLQNKYLIGARLLLLHKNCLLKSYDDNYIKFLLLYESVEQSTLLDFDRAYMLFQAAHAAKHLGGCTAECGVYKGGGSILIASICAEHHHYAMDTFDGFPDIISEIDVHEEGNFSNVSLFEIQKLFSGYQNITILKGGFSDSFNKIRDKSFSFVHVDADLYRSTYECCDFFYPRLIRGAILLFDDYLVPDTPGVKKAVDEIFDKKVEYPIVLPTCQAMVIKV